MESLEQIHPNASVSRILRFIKERGLHRLEPSFASEKGAYYGELSEFSVEEQTRVLDVLVREGIATTENAGSLLQCKSCNGVGFYNSYFCTFCKSTDIARGEVIRHNKCNNIDFDYNFMSKNNELVCGKCNLKLKAIGVDYSRQGSFFKCLKCDAMTPNTNLRFTCIRCNKIYSEDDLGVFRLSAYNIDNSKLEVFLKESNYLLSLTEELQARGINCTYGDTVLGRSNVQHPFTIVVYGGSSEFESKEHIPMLVVDVIDPTTDGHAAVLTMIAKCIDIPVLNRLLVATPELNGEGKSIASMYGITVIESQKWSEAKKELIKVISQKLNEIENESSSANTSAENTIEG